MLRGITSVREASHIWHGVVLGDGQLMHLCVDDFDTVLPVYSTAFLGAGFLRHIGTKTVANSI